MPPFLETDRLTLRRFTSDDVDHIVALDADPVVMRYLTNGVPTPRPVVEEQLRTFIQQYDEWPGLGRWAAIERATGAFVGWFALDPTGAQPGPDAGDPTVAELGYRLAQSVWRRGYGTEGARALVSHGFTELGLIRVWAQTMAVNTASRRVMENAGLRYTRTFHLEFDDPIPGTELGEVEYAITRHGWRP
jgi:RimJ/RimL family protein N-acetyltransferase